ncbi:MAG: hypothetical protein R8G66_17410 [Cytophagales bacterium]|nr:hypothetical protein [Cytophagales bacterium]
MKHHRYLSIPTIFLIVLTVFVSCQESTQVSTLDQQNDQALLNTALAQADQYVSDLEATVPEVSRSEWEKPDVLCILYKFKNGNGNNGRKLLYNAWDERRQGYIEVTEEEVTAIVKPNTIICHFRGSGLLALNAIEFDEASRNMIGAANNFEYWRNYWWITFIPPSVPEDVTLKYDIVYDIRNDGEGPIRLDPKVVVVPPSI